MRRFRLMCVALLAVFALGVVAASAAQAEEAPYFTVTGTRLAAGETRFFSSKAASNFVLTGNGGIVVTCTSTSVSPGSVLLGSNVGEPGTSDEVASFSSCKVEGDGTGSECGKVAEPITSANLKSELVLDKTKTKLLVLVQPASGNLFATIKFPEGCKGGTCNLTGSLVAEGLNEKEESITTSSGKEQFKSGLVRFPATQPVDIWLLKGGVGKEVEVKALELAATPAKVSGTGLVLLAELNSKNELVSTGEVWSALA
jgi:hypothetical protein